jgi:hypothetical protein
MLGNSAGLSRRRYLALFAPAALMLSACKGKRAGAGVMTFKMGERASVGRLIYVVTEAEWKTTLGEGATARVPEHRFLMVRCNITNSGAEPVNIPLLSLYSEKGEAFRELDNGEHVTNWMGLLRRVSPSETFQGAMLFDVAPAAYKLQITDGGDVENESISYVEIPLQMEADPVLAEPPALPKTN